MPSLSFESPVGLLTLVERDGAIVALEWEAIRSREETPLLREAHRQVSAYFDRRLRDFDLPIAPEGTPFQRRVYEAMRRIPYGETRSYGELAREVRSVARAVGGACGSNPLPIIVPCHRVLAAAGAIGGFSGAGGRDTKRKLLALESPSTGLLV